MKKSEVMKRIEDRKSTTVNAPDATTFHKDGSVTFKWSYFYRFGRTADYYCQTVKIMFPDAHIIDAGDHWHAFIGGAKTGGYQDSYMWVRFFPEKEMA